MGIVINGSAAKKLSVTLVGKNYKVAPPKAAVALTMAQNMQKEEDEQKLLDFMYEWIDLLFTKTDAVAVKKRLMDPKDLLDFEHISELMGAVMDSEENPTTSS